MKTSCREPKFFQKHVIYFGRLEQVLKKTAKVNKSILYPSEDYLNGAVLIWSISNINYQVLKFDFRYYFTFNLMI